MMIEYILQFLEWLLPDGVAGTLEYKSCSHAVVLCPHAAAEALA